MHFSEGKIRAYIDDELLPAEHTAIFTHLQVCELCQKKYINLIRNAKDAERFLSPLTRRMDDSVSNIDSAKRNFRKLVLAKKNRKQAKLFNFAQLLTSKKYQFWFATSLVLLVIGISLAFPQVRAVAVEFLAIFRVQQLEVVEFNPANLPKEIDQRFTTLEKFLSNNIKVDSTGDPQEITNSKEASELSGMKVRLPSKLSGDYLLSYQPSVTFQFQADIKTMTAFLKEVGEIDVVMPKSLEGETIKLEIGNSVTFVSGTCLLSDDQKNAIPVIQRTCISFTQMPSPKISAPPGLDLEPFGISLLQVLGLSKDEAKAFSEDINWSTTLVIPVPQGADYKKIEIDNVSGVLLEEGGGQDRQYALIWVKNEILYGLSGIGNLPDAYNFVSSLK